VALDEALEQVKDDPSLRAVLQTARSWGVAPSRLMGREPAVTAVPDRDGWRLVREPEWTDEDRDLALALDAYESGLCSGCRQPLSESTDPDNEGRYKTDLPIRCHACTALGIGAEPYEESNQPQALRFGVQLKPRPASGGAVDATVGAVRDGTDVAVEPGE
jgi:hypothetical protein